VTGRLQLSTDRLRGRAVVRSADEEHRAATPLELFFDLTFVVAIGRASAIFHHELVERHFVHGFLGFAMAFFAVWWAWMNYTWFASAHDSDDVAHRLLTFVQMIGVLVLTAGIPNAIEDGWMGIVTLGYVIMRLGLVASWLRVARDEPTVRSRALRYALDVSVLQVFWVLRLALPHDLQTVTFLVLAVGEMLVPFWVERASDGPVFHGDHIEERYGLFTIIILGETILAAAAGFQTTLDVQGLTAGLLAIGLCGMVLAFGSWWLYFDHPGHIAPSPDVAFAWGYAHVAVFLPLAALGPGIEVAIDAETGHATDRLGALAVAIPMAGYLLGLVIVMVVTGTAVKVANVRLMPKVVGAAVMIAASLVLPLIAAVIVCALVIAGLVASMILVPTDPTAQGVPGPEHLS
jgi:low temperature requirement protein LtrA